MKLQIKLISLTLAAALAATQFFAPLNVHAAGTGSVLMETTGTEALDENAGSGATDEIASSEELDETTVGEMPESSAGTEIPDEDSDGTEATGGGSDSDKNEPDGSANEDESGGGEEIDETGDGADKEADEDLTEDSADQETLNTLIAPVRPTKDAAIPAGLYTISCVKDETMVLDIAGQSCALRADLVINKKNGSASQTFLITPVGGGLYKIINMASGRILDIRGGSMEMRTRIQQYKHNQTPAQTFHILKYEMPAPDDSLYPQDLSSASDATEPEEISASDATEPEEISAGDASAQEDTAGEAPAPQQETISDTAPANTAASSGELIVAFAPSSTDYVLDVCGGTMANGSGIQLYRFNGTEAQQFKLTPAAQPILTAGTYAIHSALDLANAFDIPSASTASKASLRLWKGNYTPAQQFTVSEIACPDAVSPDSFGSYGYVGNGDYYGTDKNELYGAQSPLLISPVCSSLALDIESGNIAEGTDVRQYVENGTVAQAWVAFANGNGTYTIASAANPSYVLDVSDGAGERGANIAIRRRVTDENGITAARQSFLFEKVDAERILPDGPFKISTTPDPDLVLEIQKGSFDLRGNVRIHTWNDTNAQKYNLTYRGSGRYVITNARSGKVLDIAGGTVAKRTNIQQYRPNQTAAQDWLFVSLGGGAYTIVSDKDRNYCLDVAGGVIASDTNVQLYSRNGTAAQSFTLTPVRRVPEDWISCLKAAQTSYNTLIAVEASGTTCKVSLHKKDAKGEWKQLLNTSGYIGANGLGKTREGDRKTPVGVFAALDPLGIKPNPGTALPYTQVDSTHYWVGDSASPYYNKLVSTRSVSNFNRSLSEHIIDYGFVYNYILPIGYNTAGTPYLGSAIFLHVTRGNPTLGCVSIPEDAMVTVLKNVTSKTAFIIDTPSGVRAR